MVVARQTVLVGGGTGFIGSQLCRLLVLKNYDVKIVSRMPGPKHMTWHDIETFGIPEETVAVVNVAGQNVLDPTRRWTTGFKQNVWNSRVVTTQSLKKAIVSAVVKPSVFVSMSGVGIYKPSQETIYSESSVGNPFDFLSKLCKEWEKAAELPEDVKCRQVTIRSGVVLGRTGGMIQQLYLPYSLGLGGRIGSGTQYLPWIHINDITRLILFAIEKENITGILNGVTPHTITNQEFSDAFAKALSRPAFFPLSKSLLNLIFSKERAKMLTEGQRVIPKRTQELGFQFIFPDIKSACEELVTKKDSGSGI